MAYAAFFFVLAALAYGVIAPGHHHEAITPPATPHDVIRIATSQPDKAKKERNVV